MYRKFILGGDALPMDLVSKIPKDKINEFQNILECAVKVGLSDLYGAASELPYEFLIKCIKILEANSIELPNIWH